MRLIHLVPGHSKRFFCGFLAMHLGAMLMLVWACVGGLFTVFWLLALIPLILISWYDCFRKQVWRTHATAIKEMTYLSNLNRWLIKSADNQLSLVTLCPDSVLFFGFAFLKFKQKNRFFPVSVLISSDGIGRDSFRHLQVWWGKSAQN